MCAVILDRRSGLSPIIGLHWDTRVFCVFCELKLPRCPLPQVQYNLLYRTPETNGVLEACKENGVTLVAYSPLCQGLLTGAPPILAPHACVTVCCIAAVGLPARSSRQAAVCKGTSALHLCCRQWVAGRSGC
jgi:hypothetical protein